MAQSATFNVSPDDVANVEVSFLGKDEVVTNPTTTALNTVFNNGNAQNIVTTDGTQVTGVDTSAGFDNCTEFYPSWAVSLFVNKKTGSGHGETLEYWYPSGSVTDDGSISSRPTSVSAPRGRRKPKQTNTAPRILIE